ncbi:SPFH domain-containing protein [Actinophytocola sediminis]
MPTITYDPILKTAVPLTNPPTGTALVLETTPGGTLVVLPGEHLPDPDTAAYRRSHLVDLTLHRLSLEAELPSQDRSFVFAATVTFTCQVTNPAMVAAAGIRDLTSAIQPRLVKILRAVAQRYDVLDVAVAEAALNSALDRYYGNSAVRLGQFLVELETGDLSALHELRRLTRWLVPVSEPAECPPVFPPR